MHRLNGASNAVIAAALCCCFTMHAAHAGTHYLTYLCRDYHKTYSVTVDFVKGASDYTITWRGKTYRNVKVGKGCKQKFVGTGIDLCTATKGFASLKVGDKDYPECVMPGVPHSAE